VKTDEKFYIFRKDFVNTSRLKQKKGDFVAQNANKVCFWLVLAICRYINRKM